MFAIISAKRDPEPRIIAITDRPFTDVMSDLKIIDSIAFRIAQCEIGVGRIKEHATRDSFNHVAYRIPIFPATYARPIAAANTDPLETIEKFIEPVI